MLTTRWLPESSISYINSLFHVSSFPLSFFFVRVARLSLVSSRKHGLCLPPPLCIFSLKLRIPKSQFNRCSDGVLQSWKKKTCECDNERRNILLYKTLFTRFVLYKIFTIKKHENTFGNFDRRSFLQHETWFWIFWSALVIFNGQAMI